MAERAKRFVIVGNGVAGTTCAETLRKNDADCEITLIGDERWPLYNRVALPPYIKGKATRQKVFLRTVEQHAQRGINLMLETRVTKIDHEGQTVLLNTGKELPYDALLVATGGRPNRAAGAGRRGRRQRLQLPVLRRRRGDPGRDPHLEAGGGHRRQLHRLRAGRGVPRAGAGGVLAPSWPALPAARARPRGRRAGGRHRAGARRPHAVRLDDHRVRARQRQGEGDRRVERQADRRRHGRRRPGRAAERRAARRICRASRSATASSPTSTWRSASRTSTRPATSPSSTT